MNKIIGIFALLGKVLQFVRSLLLNLILFFILILFISVLAEAPKPHIPDDDALYIAPKGILVDELSYQPSALELLSDQDPEPETLVRDLIDAIKQAKTDERIRGLVLNLNDLQGGGISKLTEVGQALDDFKQSEKPVVAYADFFTQQQYYLASYADEIYVNELGGVLLTGYGVYRNYFKGAIDKLSLKFHVFRAGEYKDAIEPYTQESMSAPSREHNARWLNELWGRYTSRIESSRNLPSGAINDFIETMPESFRDFGGSHAQFAENAALVDAALTRKVLRETLMEKFGKNKEGDNFAAVTLDDYLLLSENKAFEQSDNQIGLITATGVILEGHQAAGSIGGDSLAKLIRQAREDEDLKALVIRVDSGGGSAFASEIIRQELLETRDKGLPIFISMGSVAASGGYWIATPADEIWATPETITGSIGVWGLFPNYSEAINKIGVNTDGVATSPLAAAFRPDLPMGEEIKIILQASIDNIYTTFLGITSEARALEVEAVHDIAQGRVWTGATAKELGLIDDLGTLQDVIAAAAARQNMDDYKIKEIVRPLSTKEQIMRSLMQASHNAGEHFRRAFVNGSLGLRADDESFVNLSKALQESLPAVQIVKGKNSEIVAQCLHCIPL